MNNKKVLIISYDFVPRGGVAVIRVAKFVKYLRHYNWNPTVLTVKNHNPYMLDETLKDQIPQNVRVYRLWSGVPKIILKRYRKTILKEKIKESIELTKPTLSQRISRTVFSGLEEIFFVPDNKIFWILPALFKGIRIIRKEGIDVIMTTSPPHSTHLIGFILRKWTQIPWIVDFRDEWIGNPHFLPRLRIRKKFEEMLEKSVVDASDFIIANTQKNKKNFIAKYPYKGRFVETITNGFDSEDYQNQIPIQKPRKKMVMNYIGSISIKQRPFTLFQGLEKAIFKKPILNDRLEINFIGPFFEPHKRLIYRYGLSEIIHIKGNVSYQDAIQYMRVADVLLLLIDPTKGADGMIPAKMYEYAFTGKPIFVIGNEGECTNLITKYRLGITASFYDIDSISESIQAFYEKWKKNKLYSTRLPQNVVYQYERIYLTKQLSNILDHVKTYA